MDVVQDGIEGLIAANPARFETGFMIAGQYQEPGEPYIKVFLGRSGDK
jgi:hypothetical protein